MDILFAGNTAAVSEGFYNAIEKEYRCIVLNESCIKDKLKKKNVLFFKSENDEDTEHIFRSFSGGLPRHFVPRNDNEQGDGSVGYFAIAQYDVLFFIRHSER